MEWRNIKVTYTHVVVAATFIICVCSNVWRSDQEQGTEEQWMGRGSFFLTTWWMKLFFILMVSDRMF